MVLICMNMGLFPRHIRNLVHTFLQMILQDLHAMRSEMVRGWVKQIVADGTTRHQSPDVQDEDF